LTKGEGGGLDHFFIAVRCYVSSNRHEAFYVHNSVHKPGSPSAGVVDGAVLGEPSLVIPFSLERLFVIVLSFLHGDRFCRADLCADGIAHAPTAIALNGHFHCGRGIDDPERADHDTHPAGDTGRLVDVNQSGLGIPAHGSIGAGLQARSALAMSALEGKGFPLHKHPGAGLGSS
jgi:hypothetical protein